MGDPLETAMLSHLISLFNGISTFSDELWVSRKLIFWKVVERKKLSKEVVVTLSWWQKNMPARGKNVLTFILNDTKFFLDRFH